MNLFVDIFELQEQHASARRELMPDEFIRAILLEFQELDYLTDDPAQYELIYADTEEALNPEQSLVQAPDGSRLRLVERQVSLPTGADAPPAQLYLSEQSTGRVYRLPWLPAIIGRVDETQPQNELVAVDVSAFPSGLRVSRRHVLISAKDGVYYAESLSGNPATLLHDEESQTLTQGNPLPIAHDDWILLDRSNIRLRFMIRAAAESLTSDTPTSDTLTSLAQPEQEIEE